MAIQSKFPDICSFYGTVAALKAGIRSRTSIILIPAMIRAAGHLLVFNKDN
jgi:hypothetical protein